MDRKAQNRNVNIANNRVSDGRDVEFSEELADHEDIEAQARAKAADRRAHQREE
ncbi:hypothetical protein J2T56_003084 [Natronobacillus azotifigens]|uniref:YfhD family protein n=1 Tax=Natronobacillus azotifigens TaxID=472978 RepID=A0A9J6RB80_9BACI|nr:YfhD family protein [Natronobacillus azotifigens]MCZ0702797.1 YfhD family protein [Natronobacillus azotifigens]